MSYFSDRYKKLKEQGLCVVCGVAPANGKSRCEWCAKRVAASSKRRYKNLKEKGICVTCGKRPAKAGSARCEECSKKILEAVKQNRHKSKEEENE